jgi:hypothetical protein
MSLNGVAQNHRFGSLDPLTIPENAEGTTMRPGEVFPWDDKRWERLYPTLIALAGRVVRDSHLAEDIVSEVAFRLHQVGCTDIKSFDQFVLKIVRNRAVDWA